MSVCHISYGPLGIDYIRGSVSKERASVCVTLSELTALWNPDTVKSVYSSQSAPMPFITWGGVGTDTLPCTHAYTHTHAWTSRARMLPRPRALLLNCKSDTPRSYALCVASGRNTFSESGSGVPTTPMPVPTDWSQGFYPNSTEL